MALIQLQILHRVERKRENGVLVVTWNKTVAAYFLVLSRNLPNNSDPTF